ncbi:MAG: amino acid ABC transporter permease [Anaerolineaceae bacterium]|nr:amino acid ABC transporter permease [Anaerolineaceae bacterium]MDD4043601.1 amino acid ABC transporter permease [Anaerolineaceae bacterium]MDD4578145.1 amino acid ABC transporter permease [Anaerolineaceae bacterium]
MDFGQFISYIASGTVYTVGVTLIALPSGLLIGTILALLYVYGGKAAARVMNLYSTVFRGIPPLVLLFILFFAVTRGINLSAFWAGSLSLGIVSSAYQMEIVRGALLSVSGDQLMAARAIGMSRLQSIRYVVLPQAVRLAIPPWSNEAAIVIKDSSLVYALGVPEILRRAQLIGASSQRYLLAYLSAAVIYFLLVFGTTRLLAVLEKKLTIPSNP